MAALTINSKIRMNSGYEIPRLGYGVYQTPADVTEDVVTKAFEAGYTHIDCAVVYRNEQPCGLAISKSSLPRSSIFFTSKVMARPLSYNVAKTQLASTLKNTGLEYLDLLLLHSPYGGREGRKGAWKALVEAQEEGKVRSIGVSNFGRHHLEELEEIIKELEEERGVGRGGKVDVGQYEIHPWLRHRDIVEWCDKHGVVVEAYCPLTQAQRLTSPLLHPLAKKYNKTPAQILLRWSLQKGFVPLPKSVTPTRIIENAQLYDFELTEGDMETLEMDEYQVMCGWDPTVARLED
ncbi:hypothetical protein HYALB_00001884 [Hymenoscyphus albidus]|uniref:NADP-dependent oxidoreductase domain-containing protein n=1 Tax=Hymenoscyphus albidus TaxID=595503 RepID=A0A9N9PXJ3_9HELO|nr:hypothetical protein HYALB_00001884 [Hymenoscyphus albidus]